MADSLRNIYQRYKSIKERNEKLAKSLGLEDQRALNLLLNRKIVGKTIKNEINYNDKHPKVNNDQIYENSLVFLKETITNNPSNDYSQYFVDTGKRPQNYIKDTSMKGRYKEYPKLRELIRLKDEFTLKRAYSPCYLKTDLRTYPLENLKNKFDVILLEPPLKEYINLNPSLDSKDESWSWEEIAALDINSIASLRSFIFLWCGSYEGLEEGRKCFKNWGFRRCEDICWVKTNLNSKTDPPLKEEGSIFVRTKEHCLMGIRGTIRRSSDIDLIHANIDLDVIVTEQPEFGSVSKPEEIFHIIEHFCMGRRRLHLFGNESAIRPGWVTVGPHVLGTNYDSNKYCEETSGDKAYIGILPEIESLRPKSPSQRNVTIPQQQQQPTIQPESNT